MAKSDSKEICYKKLFQINGLFYELSIQRILKKMHRCFYKILSSTTVSTLIRNAY